MFNITDCALETDTYSSWKNDVSLFWKDSLFEHLKNKSSRCKGSESEKLMKEIFKSKGFEVKKRKHSDHDFCVNGYEIELKMSTCWAEKPDAFRWQQIRKQRYDYILFLGVNPNKLYLWGMSKQAIIDNIFDRDEFRQHGGRTGNHENYWISTKYKKMFDDEERVFSLLGGSK